MLGAQPRACALFALWPRHFVDLPVQTPQQSEAETPGRMPTHEVRREFLDIGTLRFLNIYREATNCAFVRLVEAYRGGQPNAA